MSRGERGAVAALFDDYRQFAGARLWLALALMLVGAIAEGFGILMIVPLAAGAMGSGAASEMLDRFAPAAAQPFTIALVLFVGAMGLRAAVLYVRDVQLARLQADYEASLRLRSASTLASRGWGFASGIGQAEMQSLLLTDVPRASGAVGNLQNFAVAGIVLLVQTIVAVLLSPVLAGIALAIIVAGSIASAGWLRRGTRSGFALVERSEESASSGFRLHSGLKAALAQGTLAEFLDEYSACLAAAKMESVRFASDLTAARSLGFFASAVVAAILLAVGAKLLGLPFPVLAASLVLFARMAAPAQTLLQAAQNVAAYAPSFAAIGRRVGPLKAVGAKPAHAPALDWSELAADEIGFEHAPGCGVETLSVRLGRGEWLGIAGPSGAGKTTLVDLLAGLLPPQSGSILIDGEPLSGALLERWRASLAYVGQAGSVFDDSIRGNLLAEGAGANDAELWQSLATVGLADRVRALPAGIDSPVGDRGSRLSGGERQRLGIARALLRRPSLLILDEATSALDEAAETALFTALRGLDPRPAAIVIAHRSSTLSHCDSLIEIQHGEGQIR